MALRWNPSGFYIQLVLFFLSCLNPASASARDDNGRLHVQGVLLDTVLERPLGTETVFVSPNLSCRSIEE